MFAPKSRILVVDDMVTMRKIVSKTLRQLGFTDITEAADGNRAWEQLTSADPPIDVIVSDWNMPNCSGLELLKKVRGDSRFQDIPFLMVTAEAESAQIIKAMNAKVSNYVVKPFTQQVLQQKLEDTHKKYSKVG